MLNVVVRAFAGGNTCEKIMINAINSEALINDELLRTISPPISNNNATVAIPRNSVIGLDSSNLLYIDRFCFP